MSVANRPELENRYALTSLGGVGPLRPASTGPRLEGGKFVVNTCRAGYRRPQGQGETGLEKH